MPLTIDRLGAAQGLDSAVWLPVIPDADYNSLSISNREAAAGLWICTDPTNAGRTKVYLPAGAEQGYAVPIAPRHLGDMNFWKGEPSVWIQPVSGAGPVVITWM